MNAAATLRWSMRGGYRLLPPRAAPNSQTVMGTYQDGIDSYSFTGKAFGFSVLVTSQIGGPTPATISPSTVGRLAR
jgi:hypothetical protein